MAHQASDSASGNDTALINVLRPLIYDFPLPAELKDQIYGYLLDGAQVQHTPNHSSNAKEQPYKATRAYAFHPQIMAVNKTIRAHALQALKNKNTFLVVTFDSPACCSYRKLLSVLDLPLVQKNVTTCRYRSFEILVQRHGCSSADDTGDAFEKYSVLMLQRDLHRLWEIIHFQGQVSAPQCAYVMSDYGESLRLTKPKTTAQNENLSVSITACAEGRKSLSTARQQCILLRSLKPLEASGCALYFDGFGEAASAHIMEGVSKSSLLSVAAMDVEILRAFRAMSEHIYADVLAGRERSAIAKFAALNHNTSTSLFQMDCADEQMEDQRDEGILPQRLDFAVNLMMTMFWAFLRLGLFDQLPPLIDLVQFYWLDVDVGTNFGHHAVHMTLVKSLCEGTIEQLSEQNLRGILNRLKMDGKDDEYVLHDAVLIMKALDGNAGSDTPTKLNIPRSELSAFALPPRVYNLKLCSKFHLAEDQYRNFDEFVKWQDTKQFSNFTIAEKDAILNFQRENGLPVSTFD